MVKTRSYWNNDIIGPGTDEGAFKRDYRDLHISRPRPTVFPLDLTYY